MIAARMIALIALFTVQVHSEMKVGCQFRPSKPSEVTNTKDAKACDVLCSANRNCTHFNWYAGGRCERFQSMVSTKDRYPMRPGEWLVTCGLNYPAWTSLKGGFFADHCRFPEEMEPYHSYPSVPFNECFDDCRVQEHCTHFMFEGPTTAESGTCHLMGWMELQGEGRTVILPRNKAPLRSCGYFLRYRPPSIRDIVNDHWPAFMGGIILLAFIGLGFWCGGWHCLRGLTKGRQKRTKTRNAFIAEGQVYEINEMEQLPSQTGPQTTQPASLSTNGKKTPQDRNAFVAAGQRYAIKESQEDLTLL